MDVDRRSEIKVNPLDELAFEQNLVSLLPTLRRYAAAMTGSLPDADDIVQSALVRALERRKQYRGGRLDAWLFAIMRSIWRNHARRYALERSYHYQQATDSDHRMLGSMDNRLLLSDVDRVLATMPGEWRELALVVCVYGYSYREAAELLDIQIGTVMSRVSRIRKILNRALNSQDEESSTNARA